MPNQDLDDRKPTDDGLGESSVATTKDRNFDSIKILIAAIFVSVAIFAAYKADLLEPIIHWSGFQSADKSLSPVFTRLPGDDVISSGSTLAGVGKIPYGHHSVGPAVAFDQPVPQDGSGKTQSQSAVEISLKAPTSVLQSDAQTSKGPMVVETPVIPNVKPPLSDDTGKVETTAEGKGGESSAPKAAPTKPSGNKETPDWQETTRSEQFQLPGSLLVRIQNYSGAPANWQLMVILDDSGIMLRQGKTWSPSRSKIAVNFVSKLPGTLPPGSKLAVRDFVCQKSNENNKKGPCLSHMLFDWSSPPFKQLKEKLENADWGGQTDPCAAAAYSVNHDFRSQGSLIPRILIVTGGATKCGFNGVVKAVESLETKDKLAVDVLALGINKKRLRGYSTLANKTGGLFMPVDKPADVDQFFSRYEKALKTKVMEKVEVKGDKTVSSISPFQEANLIPGSYTVVLPIVEGLHPSNRTISNVKIISGEVKIMDITIKKGRPIVREGKK